MKEKKIDRAKRQAAGHACLAMFGLCNTISHSIRQIAATHPPSGVGLGKGLTEKEREFVVNLATKFHDNGELLRKLGWRFRGVDQ